MERMAACRVLHLLIAMLQDEATLALRIIKEAQGRLVR
jgi:hypothetical protein